MWRMVILLLAVVPGVAIGDPGVAESVRRREILEPSRTLVSVARSVLQRYDLGHRMPNYGVAMFEWAHDRNMCQANVKDLVETAIFGRPDSWSEAGCCAMSTCANLRSSARRGVYIEIDDLDLVRPGDLVYLTGGWRCRTCGRPVGHAMVCTGRASDGRLTMWQNTTIGGTRGLREIPIVDDQAGRFVAAFRIPRYCRKVVVEPTPSIPLDVDPRPDPSRFGISLLIDALTGVLAETFYGGGFDARSMFLGVPADRGIPLDARGLRADAQRAWLSGDAERGTLR